MQLLLCNDQLKAEVALKNEALIQTASSQQLLRVKSEVSIMLLHHLDVMYF